MVAFFFYYKSIRGPHTHTTRLHGCGRRGGGNHTDDGFFLQSRKQIILNIIKIIHLLHSYIHCDLDHSTSKLHKLHDHHYFLPPGREIFIRRRKSFPPQYTFPRGGKFPIRRGKFSLLAVGNPAQNQISRRRGGSHVTRDLEGEHIFLKKFLQPLG